MAPRCRKFDGDDDAWEIDHDFPEVPAAGLRDSLWQTALSGAWRDDEQILILEARSLVTSFLRILFTRHGWLCRQLGLVDNMSVCLAFERARSGNFGLLVLIRKLYAACLANKCETILSLGAVGIQF